MTDDLISMSNMNDFLFCPVSIYFHNLMDGADRIMIQTRQQINGSHAHNTIENGTYSSRKDVLQGIGVYCERYGLVGKIDVFDAKTGILTERKKRVSKVYDGQIFQVYAQYFALREMGHDVKRIRIHSIEDNKNHELPLPEDNKEIKERFEKTVDDMHRFDPDGYVQENRVKCMNCIYEPMCGSSSLD